MSNPSKKFSPESLISRQTALSANIVQLCRYLRHKGFSIGPREEADALHAMLKIPLDSPSTLQVTLKAVLCKSLKTYQTFDEHYQTYWKNLERALDSKVKPGGPETQPEKPQPQTDQPPSLQSLKNWLQGNQSQESTELAAYSPIEVITQKDFSTFSEEELLELMKIIRTIARTLAKRQNRRYQKSRQAQHLDIKQTLRLNMRRGGELVDLAFRRKRKRRLNLILLCDVSKSMDLYSQFLIHFMYAFQNSYQRLETFVFSTSLHRISEELKEDQLSEALEKISTTVPNWSGGTKIGTSLNSFCQTYASRFLNKQSIVLILSDGWDTGDTEILAESMRQIHKKAAQVIWLNPLAGNPNFEPKVQGMQVSLPYIDLLLPAHNVESLKEVISHLHS